jgi:hypothetical protein
MGPTPTKKYPPPQKHKTCSLSHCAAPLALLFCPGYLTISASSSHQTIVLHIYLSDTSIPASILAALIRDNDAIDRFSSHPVVTSTTQGPPLRAQCTLPQHVGATTTASPISPIMDPSQYFQHHHRHSQHHYHHKSLSQQQSSASLSSTTRGTPPLHTHLPSSSSMPLRTANSTPMSSPGLFSPSASRQNLVTSVSENNTPPNYAQSPLLHPLQLHKVRE